MQLEGAPINLFNDPRNTGFLSIYTRECGEVVGTRLTSVVHFRAYGKEVVFASSVGLTDDNETFLFNHRIRQRAQCLARIRAVRVGVRLVHHIVCL